MVGLPISNTIILEQAVLQKAESYKIKSKNSHDINNSNNIGRLYANNKRKRSMSRNVATDSDPKKRLIQISMYQGHSF